MGTARSHIGPDTLDLSETTGGHCKLVAGTRVLTHRCIRDRRHPCIVRRAETSHGICQASCTDFFINPFDNDNCIDLDNYQLYTSR